MFKKLCLFKALITLTLNVNGKLSISYVQVLWKLQMVVLVFIGCSAFK